MVTAVAVPLPGAQGIVPPAERARRSHVCRLGWSATAAGAVLAACVLTASRMQIVPMSAVQLFSIVATLGCIHVVYGRYRPNIRIELASGALAMMIASALAAGIMSNAGLRLRHPLIDATLAQADAAMGIDTPAVVLAFVGHPVVTQLLDLCYLSAFPLAFLVAAICAVRGQTDRVWETSWSFSVCILVCSAVAALYPAIGNVPHAGLEGLAGHGLPAGSGTYHLQAFRSLYGGSDPQLDLRQLEGVVTFPSFHVIMGLIVAWALRGNGLTTAVAVVWCAAVAISTVPIGGHYVTDLIAGSILWAVCVRIARRQACRAAG